MSATMIKRPRPSWYTRDDDSAWDRVKEAFRRDWQQTKHDFGGDEPDLNQDVDDTVAQATGANAIPPANVPSPEPKQADEPYNASHEPAYRYGYAAYRHYGHAGDWNAEREAMFEKDWGEEWSDVRPAIRRGWFYAKCNKDSCGTCKE
jgi:hypothetical protein